MYILIILILSEHYGVGISQQEYGSKLACEIAKDEIVTLDNSGVYSIKIICTPKD